MEPAIPQISEPPIKPIRLAAKLLAIMNTGVNVLGWGSFAAIICLGLTPNWWGTIIALALGSLIFLVPASLFINLCIIFCIFYDGINQYGSLWTFLKHIPWKKKGFILGCISSLLYLIGCTLVIFVMTNPFLWSAPALD